MPTFESPDGTSLFYTDWGTGAPVVLVHGLALGSDMWEYQVPALVERGLRVVAYDQRGCGRSDTPGRGYDFDTLADDLAALVGDLGLDGATLVGYSLGGGVIARYLTRHGTARVARTALVASTTPYLLRSDDNPEGVDRALIYDAFLAGLRQDRPKLLAEIAVPFFGPAGVSDDILRWVLDLCDRGSATAMAHYYRLANEADVRADMASFSVPTLVVHGDTDPLNPIEATGARTARAIAGSRLHVYEGASHGLFYTHRHRLNGDLAEWCGAER
jgi:pimeloyl-ACP methyl ester carboxylesterase